MAELQVPDPCVVLLVGAAGAGKSTFAARNFPAEAIFSSDALREVIAGDAADQAVSRAAFAALHRAIDRRLASGGLAVVDATNVTAAGRHAINRIAAGHGIPVVAVVFDLPEDVVQRQNAQRLTRHVPRDVVARHVAALARTLETGGLETDGYAQVVRLRTAGDVAALMVRPVSGLFRDR